MNPYLRRHALLPPQIENQVLDGIELFVCIPACCEPHLERTLRSLRENSFTGRAEVLILFNYADDDPRARAITRDTYRQCQRWCRSHTDKHLVFHAFEYEMPSRSAGVGLARKVLFDEVIHRLESTGRTIPIASLDADTMVQKNYLDTLVRAFAGNPSMPAANVHFEHPLEGQEFGDEIYLAIACYELHLRYHVQALRAIHYPFAFLTLGSAFACRSDSYQTVGGMNRRQAGEDFYFIHKFTGPLFGFIGNTTVQPSPRPSGRVPFGTGPAVRAYLEKGVMETYHPDAFRDLEQLLAVIPQFHTSDYKKVRIPLHLRDFLDEQGWPERLVEIGRNTASQRSFVKRCYKWLHPLRVVKYLNVASEKVYGKLPVQVAAAEWISNGESNPRYLLETYRQMYRTTHYLPDYYHYGGNQ